MKITNLVKTKRFWLLLLLGTIIVLVLCFFITTLALAWIDFKRFKRYDWPGNLESNSLFWIELCMASVDVDVHVLAPCVVRWFRLLCNCPSKRKEITRITWFKRFTILTVCVAVLTLIAAWRNNIYTPMIREKWDWAWVFANRYYPFVIADIFAIGAWVRWVVSGVKSYFVSLKATSNT